jgi:hypothetical protein
MQPPRPPLYTLLSRLEAGLKGRQEPMIVHKDLESELMGDVPRRRCKSSTNLERATVTYMTSCCPHVGMTDRPKAALSSAYSANDPVVPCRAIGLIRSRLHKIYCLSGSMIQHLKRRSMTIRHEVEASSTGLLGLLHIGFQPLGQLGGV